MAVSKLPQADNNFVGREGESAFFRDSLLRPDPPTFTLYSLYGISGVGKSTLLDHFERAAKQPEFQDYCLIVRVSNPTGRSAADLMFEFAEKFKQAGHPLPGFKKAYETFLRTKRGKLKDNFGEMRESFKSGAEKGGETLSGIFLPQTPAKIAGKVAGAVGGFALGQVQDQREFERMRQEGRELLTLSRVFFEDLNKLAQSRPPRQGNRKWRIGLLIDDFERVADSLSPWLLECVFETEL